MADVTLKSCECGCGEPTRLAPRTRGRQRRGEPLRFLPGHGRRDTALSNQQAWEKARNLDPAFGHWLAGFADGEGCFQITKNGRGAHYCEFRLGLAVADATILFEIANRTGLGKAWVAQSPSQERPVAVWYVNRKAHAIALVELFRRFPLRAKKRHDFEVWARAVDVWATHAYRDDWQEMNELREELLRVRRGESDS